MMQRRKYARVDLNFPIFCLFTDNDLKLEIRSAGHVHDLSIGGMKICVPLPPDLYNSRHLSYALHLPEPFNTITGQGQIKWSEKIDENHCVVFGVEFTELNDQYRRDIQAIIEELVDH